MAKVIRNGGVQIELESSELVGGDVVVLDEGDSIPTGFCLCLFVCLLFKLIGIKRIGWW